MEKIIAQNKQWIDETWEKLDAKLKVVSERSKNKLPYTTIDGVHDDKATSDVAWWTNGFWGAMMMLMYSGTKDEHYLEVARSAQSLLDGAFNDFTELHHDVGFMWYISSGADYKLTGDQGAKNRALFAASTLAGRFNPKGGYIKSWNNDAGWVIIDCMMNIPLLYWASKEIGDDRYKNVAMAHADKTMETHIRPDGSVNHIVNIDPETGDVIETFGGQGYAVGSSWTRGQSWAIYGYVQSYIHTGKQEYLDVAKKVAHYFIANLNDSFVPPIDFREPEEPKTYDTTAGAITACGLIEIAKCVPEFEKKMYLKAAINILKETEEKFCNWSLDEDSIVQYGSEAYHAKPTGINIPIIYGDYYFIDAIHKLKGFESFNI